MHPLVPVAPALFAVLCLSACGEDTVPVSQVKAEITRSVLKGTEIEPREVTVTCPKTDGVATGTTITCRVRIKHGGGGGPVRATVGSEPGAKVKVMLPFLDREDVLARIEQAARSRISSKDRSSEGVGCPVLIPDQPGTRAVCYGNLGQKYYRATIVATTAGFEVTEIKLRRDFPG